MENGKKAVCTENDAVVAYLFKKRQELAQSAKGISDNMDMTLSKAYSNICNHKTPVRTLKDLSEIKGVGKWILKQMQGFFQIDSSPPDNDDLTKQGKKNKGPKRYVPQKNSVAYALLITLFRGTEDGNEFMLKKDLIDAAETSGLSRVPIAPEKAKGKAGHFGSSPRDWYSGWSCMKTLITRGLVVKSSCPAKYMLTEEGKKVVGECLLRSGMISQNKSLGGLEGCSTFSRREKLRVDTLEDLSDSECVVDVSFEKAALNNFKKPKTPEDVPPDYLEKFISMGFSRQQIVHAISEIMETSQGKEISSLWPTVLCRLREAEIYGQAGLCSSQIRHTNGASSNQKLSLLHDFGRNSCTLKACSSSNVQDNHVSKLGTQGPESKSKSLAMPPLAFGEKFGDVYEVILVLDNREQFATQGSRSRKIIENICSQFQIQIEVPQVTEDIALAVLDMYPTLLSLARAYSLLDGDVNSQEEMLKKQSNNLISGSASKNIFQLIWGS